jgi:predicted Rossmann fold nucleotide-binding protein DprA/Smf involved in DNA uptake
MSVQQISVPESVDGLVQQLFAIGNVKILQKPALAFLCSSKCPASLIIKSHDLANRFKLTEQTVISGFHSPVEKEFLTNLLQGRPTIVVCKARSIHNMRIPADWKPVIEAGRLLIISPFCENQKRATTETARHRNVLVANFAEQVIVAHASKGGKTEKLVNTLLLQSKSVFTLDSDHNQNLISAGVAVYGESL